MTPGLRPDRSVLRLRIQRSRFGPALGRVKRQVLDLGASLPRPRRLPWGTWMITWNDVMGGHLRGANLPEPEETAFMRRILRPGMKIFDIGAHNGYYSLLSSAMVGPHGHVTAFEPSPRERRRLRLNLRLNRLTNVTVEGVAVGAITGSGQLFVCDYETGCNSLRPPAVNETTTMTLVQLTSLDDYCRESGVVTDLVKIDVEGGERDVLRGAVDVLSLHRPLVLCEVADIRTEPWGYRAVEIYDFLTSLDYHWYSIGPDGILHPCSRKEAFHENLVAVPREKVAVTLAGEGESVHEPSVSPDGSNVVSFARVPIERVREFRNCRPRNIANSPAPVGTRQSFDEVKASKHFVSRQGAPELVERPWPWVQNVTVDHIFPCRIEDHKQYHHVRNAWFRWLPDVLFRLLERAFGWHLCVTAIVV